ncbi:MAG: hypothetical protein ABF899_01620 [Oenococcus sp.]|uniref:hypothetical protein n=1 Tax=Oenococcus sp. TaxID=1979414 RepID=UPI0039EBFF4F
MMEYDKWNKLRAEMIAALYNNGDNGVSIQLQDTQTLEFWLNEMSLLDTNEFNFKLNQAGLDDGGNPIPVQAFGDN